MSRRGFLCDSVCGCTVPVRRFNFVKRFSTISHSAISGPSWPPSTSVKLLDKVVACEDNGPFATTPDM